MTLIVGLALGFAAAMAIIWVPPYPEPERHEHMRALDRLAESGRRCACGAPADVFGNCLGPCAGEDWER